jgi:hypothetical protein
MKKTYSFDLAAKKLQDCNVIATQPVDAESRNVNMSGFLLEFIPYLDAGHE